MARVLLACWGSYGDLFPSIAIADRLRARGHTPVVASCPYYRDLVEREGLAFMPLGPDVVPDDGALIARQVATDGGAEAAAGAIVAVLPGAGR